MVVITQVCAYVRVLNMMVHGHCEPLMGTSCSLMEAVASVLPADRQRHLRL